ncbi:hypothetical protein B0T11DRAFT_343705 [Plectosphaerella cucumerina]|uniref:DUF7708 domain-containing protein n=1 Tax=Plectosphaerella cucumerina TaxID=40658 RepID=A0A8K0WXY7_9PEZI|nr:hypothetical protein B0T11DRAFT_343705 [Plectosphaerella cucumerina]
MEIPDLSLLYTTNDQVEPAGDTFQNALHMFSSELSDDPEKLRWIHDNHVSVESVFASVEDAQSKYEGRKGDSKTREALTVLAEKIHYYRGFMDVIATYHPEYTALFWGATKFFLVGVINHQKVITRISEGLVQIANLLPMADATARLYPVPRIRKIIEAIYAYTIRFLIRALRWYQEGKFKHIIHSITRPTETRYDDILSTITTLSRSMTDAAATSSQAEQRDMHLGLLKQTKVQEALQTSLGDQDIVLRQVLAGVGSVQDQQQDTISRLEQLISGGHDEVKGHLSAILLEIVSIKSGMQAIQATSKVVLHQHLSIVQVSEVLVNIAVSQLPNPQAAQQTSLFLARKRRTRPSARGPPFWLEDKIQRWNSSVTSSLVVVDGTRKMRFHLQWYCAETISVLRESGIPVIWALKTMMPGGDYAEDGVSSIDMIKYLVSQTVLLNPTMHTEAAMSPRLHSFKEAKSDSDWINILGSVLQGLPHLYVVLDVEVLKQTSRGGLVNLTAKLSELKVETVVKIVMINYSPLFLRGTLDGNFKGDVVPAIDRW